ncbi:cysteine-rich repeat secretory protein 38-like [Rhodamnia argentea]|uniref:Cysteine-rich repeat secretory protein 38-like n=1 Tax=Rhodamnia argentea TaxID=178133 RepID=A0ABM3H6I7_9MYRT|nr:cysteine-rich repeat secretory protein 38-like [Rhodamnia argentea]
MNPPNLPLLLLLVFASTINAQFFPKPYCGSTGNFTADSTYETTLTTLLSSISTTKSLSLTYGFFNTSSAVSGTSQILYVIGSCHGDLTAESCRACLDASASDIRRLCPLQKEAVLYSENCTVRYSNASIFGTVTTDPGYQLSNVNDVTSPDTYNTALRSLLDGLQAEAAGGDSLRKYATGDVPVGLYTIYAMEQCTPDLTEQNCRNCLATVFQRLVVCCAGKMGVKIMAPSCQIRYETNDQFFDPVGEPLPPPPPAASPRQLLFGRLQPPSTAPSWSQRSSSTCRWNP